MFNRYVDSFKKKRKKNGNNWNSRTKKLIKINSKNFFILYAYNSKNNLCRSPMRKNSLHCLNVWVLSRKTILFIVLSFLKIIGIEIVLELFGYFARTGTYVISRICQIVTPLPDQSVLLFKFVEKHFVCFPTKF